MDADLKCNRLTCRRPLTDKAVVTTCSHIFCIDCANELFNPSRLCPACDTNLAEPDDVVVCSLHPTNDYKTSVLSGLTPATILEICSRAISFWQYQIHQESTFQQAVVRNLNDKNAQLQKQLDNVLREANGELNLLNNKKEELERDLELERRKVRELQEGSRERDREYAKLKVQFDKLKRKALLGPVAGGIENGQPSAMQPPHQYHDEKNRHQRGNMVSNVTVSTLVGGMEANGVQRTPLVARTNGGGFVPASVQQQTDWSHHRMAQGQPTNHQSRNVHHRQPFGLSVASAGDRSYTSANLSDRSGSANEVEHMLLQQPGRIATSNGWQVPYNNPPTGRSVFAPAPNTSVQRPSRGFRPAVMR